MCQIENSFICVHLKMTATFSVDRMVAIIDSIMYAKIFAIFEDGWPARNNEPTQIHSMQTIS